MVVSDYGLVDGERSARFDGYTLRLHLAGSGTTELQWFKLDNTPQKSAPAAIKNNAEFAARLKTMQDLAKQAKQASSIQRDRIDRLYIDDVVWSMADFERYYLQHGLVGPIARKLLWSPASATVRNGRTAERKAGRITAIIGTATRSAI